MNSVLQCLLNTPGEFLEALTAFVGPRPAGLTHKAFLGSCFAKLVEEYGSKDTTPDSSFGSSFFGRVQGALPSDSTALKGLKSAMAEIDPRYGTCQQQDAYEFLGTLLEGLDENLGALFSAQFMQSTSPGDSTIRSVCGLTTYVTRKCHCCGEVFTVDRSTDTAIRLPLLSEAAQMDEAQRLKEQSQPIELQQLLLDMQKPEDIEGYDCDKCREHAKSTGCEHVRSKVTQQCGLIGDSQDILVFALYRFLNVLDKNGKFGAVKVKREVKIPTQLSLPTGKYHLYGVVSHKGENLTHGHYISAVRSLRDDQWYDCDDSMVKPIALRKLYENSEITATRPNADPFILFYHRVEGGGASSASSQPATNETPKSTSALGISSNLLSHSRLPQLPATPSMNDCAGGDMSPMTCEEGDVPSMTCQPAASDTAANDNPMSPLHSLNDQGRCSSHVTSYVSSVTHQPAANDIFLFLSLDASETPDTTFHSPHDFLTEIVNNWQ
jgi:ubiquitin C-terminal hydrolase